jgi:guanylate kinase
MKNNRKTEKNRGLLVVLSGPSGVGKNSMIRALIDDDPNLFHSISIDRDDPSIDTIILR